MPQATIRENGVWVLSMYGYMMMTWRDTKDQFKPRLRPQLCDSHWIVNQIILLYVFLRIATTIYVYLTKKWKAKSSKKRYKESGCLEKKTFLAKGKNNRMGSKSRFYYLYLTMESNMQTNKKGDMYK